MAYCHGPNSPYGCGHEQEHKEAARKGWITRRQGFSEREKRWLGRVTGSAEDIHEHAGGRVMFRSGGNWFELPRSEARRLIRAGKADELQEMRNKQRAEKDRQRQMRAEERRQRAERRDKERQARLFEGMQRAEYNDVIRSIRSIGGIKRSVSRNTGREYDRGEYNSLPASVRARKGQGLTLDYAREAVAESYPWLDVDTTDDLLRFFDKEHTRRMNRVRRAA